MRREGFTQSMTVNWIILLKNTLLGMLAQMEWLWSEDQTITYHVNFLISKIILRACHCLEETHAKVFRDDGASRWQFVLTWFIKKKIKLPSLYHTSFIL